jgi:8-oxo-dGTP pyrophosphatase MutT (NUDIX family)
MTVRVASQNELEHSAALDDARDFVAGAAAADLAETRARMLTFADEHADALDRNCTSGHFTGSALVVDPSTQRFLVLHHTKLQRWLQPGGHADGNANLAAVAQREATEETGIVGLQVVVPAIDLDIHLVEPPHEPPHHHYDVRFLVIAPGGSIAAGNHESTALRWITIADCDELGCDPGVARMARAGLRVLATIR